jgi:hypothetical protein
MNIVTINIIVLVITSIIAIIIIRPKNEYYLTLGKLGSTSIPLHSKTPDPSDSPEYTNNDYSRYKRRYNFQSRKNNTI